MIALLHSTPPPHRGDALLEALLRGVGVRREDCLELAAELYYTLPDYDVDIVVCLGDSALRATHPHGSEELKADAWRGSMFMSRDLSAEPTLDTTTPNSASPAPQADPALLPLGDSAYGVGTGHPPDGIAASQDGESANPAELQTTLSKGVAPPLARTHSEHPELTGIAGAAVVPCASAPVAVTACGPSESTPPTAFQGTTEASIAAVADAALSSPRRALSPVALRCLSTLDPARLMGQSDLITLLGFDLRRAVEEARTPGPLALPQRTVEWGLSADDIVSRLDALLLASEDAPVRVGHDIEGWPGTGVTDFSFATSSTHAFWVPLRRSDWAKWWTPVEEEHILLATRAVLASQRIHKVCHNGINEMFTWRWAHEVTMQGLADDSMLAFQELYAELPRNLSTVSSVLTREPYYGEATDQTTPEERARYNGLDSMLSLECADAILALPEWSPGMERHYRHRMALLPAVLYQQVKGLCFDTEARTSLLATLDREVYARQGELDALAGIAAPTLAEVARAVCNKAKVEKGLVETWDDVVTHANPSWLRKAEVVP